MGTHFFQIGRPPLVSSRTADGGMLSHFLILATLVSLCPNVLEMCNHVVVAQD